MNIKTNELLLLSGNDVPFVEGQLIIHQPTLKEIAFLGEEVFFTGCELLKFSKEILSPEDKINLAQYSDFHIFMIMMTDKNAASKFNVDCAKMVLDLIFPKYVINFTEVGIVFASKENKQQFGILNTDNFDAFKDILKAMFCLEKTSSSTDYNPEGDLAEKIAEKFRKRNQKLAEAKGKPKKVAIFSRYVSILAVGEKKDINSFMNYTVYQLYDEFQRFELKMASDIFFKARLAGAQDMKQPEDWMKDIHE